MVSPSGTYDAIAFLVALPKGTVNDMLPEWLKDQFQPIPDAFYDAFSLKRKTENGEDTHIIVVQLGYQRNTGVGPSIMRQFRFHEAKIDIPFLKHYYRRHIDGDAIPFAYKQVIIFSLRLMQVSGLVIPGSRSLLGKFGPEQTPYSYESEAPTLEYHIDSLIDASLKRASETEDEGQGWIELRKLLTMPWFGGKTGKTAVEFHFDWNASDVLPPRAYSIKTNLTQAFLGLNADKHLPIEVSTIAWRYRAPYTSVEKSAPTY